jgi:hypothetical protein
MPAPDPRRQEGGTCWARADQVSCDSKRVYGSMYQTTWLKGTALQCFRKEGKSRATTMVKARFTVGNQVKIVDLALQLLKDRDPAVVAAGSTPFVIRLRIVSNT